MGFNEIANHHVLGPMLPSPNPMPSAPAKSSPKPDPQPCRAQVAALPLRQGRDGLEVMLITSRESRRWIVPKGWPMKGLKDHEAAAREALEEAGLKGRIHKRPIGAYTYGKRTAHAVEPCRVMVYRLDVDGERTSWRERGQRERQWFAVAEAAELVDPPRLASMILACAAPADEA